MVHIKHIYMYFFAQMHIKTTFVIRQLIKTMKLCSSWYHPHSWNLIAERSADIPMVRWSEIKYFILSTKDTIFEFYGAVKTPAEGDRWLPEVKLKINFCIYKSVNNLKSRDESGSIRNFGHCYMWAELKITFPKGKLVWKNDLPIPSASFLHCMFHSGVWMLIYYLYIYSIYMQY